MKKFWTIVNAVTHTIGFLSFLYMLAAVDKQMTVEKQRQADRKLQEQRMREERNRTTESATNKVEIGFH